MKQEQVKVCPFCEMFEKEVQAQESEPDPMFYQAELLQRLHLKDIHGLTT